MLNGDSLAPKRIGTWSKTAAKLGKFGLAGLPLHVVGFVLNYSMVNVAGFAKPIAYAIVVLAQLAVSFLLCTKWVFDTEHRFSLRRFSLFALTMLVLRGVDWLLYIEIVGFGVPYLLVQLLVLTLVSVPKFVLLWLLFEPAYRPSWLSLRRKGFFCNQQERQAKRKADRVFHKAKP
jgi:putative flippase GtrA